MKKIAVLGSRGFLGSSMVKFLRKKEKFIVMTDRGDLRDLKYVKWSIAGADYVMNFCANMGGIGYFNDQNYYPVMDNFQIDLNVLKACEDLEIKRLFYPSSACAYPLYCMNMGENLSEYLLECHAQPDQMYGWEKLTITKLMEYSPVDCRVGILHTIYGRNQAYEGVKAKFPPQMAYKAILAQKTGKLEVWGDGSQTRTFLYIDDALEKIYEVMMKRNYYGPVNIGSDKEISVNDIVSMYCDILNINPKIRYNLKKPTGPTRRRCSNAKFNKHYKYRDKTSLKKGFRKLINYIKLCQKSKHQ